MFEKNSWTVETRSVGKHRHVAPNDVTIVVSLRTNLVCTSTSFLFNFMRQPKVRNGNRSLRSHEALSTNQSHVIRSWRQWGEQLSRCAQKSQRTVSWTECGFRFISREILVRFWCGKKGFLLWNVLYVIDMKWFSANYPLRSPTWSSTRWRRFGVVRKPTSEMHDWESANILHHLYVTKWMKSHLETSKYVLSPIGPLNQFSYHLSDRRRTDTTRANITRQRL